MKRRWIRKTVIALVAIWLLMAGVSALSYSPGAQSVPLTQHMADLNLRVPFRTWEQHAGLYPPGEQTYVIEVESSIGALLYFGAKHSRDRNHPQRAEIEEAWNRFEPTVALHEGRSRGFMIGPIYERLVGLPEPAIVHQLARRDDVPIYSLEPPYDLEIKQLLERWSAEQLALYFTMRGYWSEAGGEANESLAQDLLTKRTDTPSLKGAVSTVADLDRIWKRDFPRQRDWRVLKSEPRDTYLTQISDDSREARGEHMVRILTNFADRGERVFAVVGCSHVIRHEPTLRDLFTDTLRVPRYFRKENATP